MRRLNFNSLELLCCGLPPGVWVIQWMIVIFVIFLDYIWFKLSLVTRFAGMLVTPLAMCFAMLSCRSAQHLGRLVFFYIIICLLFYQFTNFNTLLDEKIRRIKTIFPVTSIISRDPSWHDMENCSVIIQGATSLYFVSFSTKYNLLSSWRGLKNVRLFRETSTMKAVLNSGRE